MTDGPAGVRPAFYWVGSKSRMAPWITSLMLPHRSYLEPFAGSAAVLLAKRPSSHETINDLDRGVVTFFRVLRDAPEDLIRAVELTPYSEQEFNECLDLDPDEIMTDVERARRFFVRTSQGFLADPKYPGWALTVKSASQTSRAVDKERLLARFSDIATRLRTVQVANRDALDIIKRFAAEEDLAIYCDPPYANDDVKIRYHHHEATLHEDLANVLHDIKGHVLISGYAGLYDELYPTWHRIEREMTVSGGADTSGSPGGSPARKTEVIWSNKPTWPGINNDS